MSSIAKFWLLMEFTSAKNLHVVGSNDMVWSHGVGGRDKSGHDDYWLLPWWADLVPPAQQDHLRRGLVIVGFGRGKECLSGGVAVGQCGRLVGGEATVEVLQ